MTAEGHHTGGGEDEDIKGAGLACLWRPIILVGGEDNSGDVEVHSQHQTCGRRGNPPPVVSVV